MKIAVVVNELDVRGGTHKQVLRLCQYLKKNNANFVLCTKVYDSEKTYPEFKDFDILYLQTKSKYRESAGKNIFKRISNYVSDNKEDRELYSLIPRDVDIINVHDCCLERFIKMAITDNKKVVWQINDLDPAFMVGAAKNQKDSFYNVRRRIKIRNIAQKVNRITVNVTKNAERVKKSLRKEATVLYCGVDENKALVKHCYKENLGEFRLLSMGVFLPYRNYEVLIVVLKQLREKGVNIRLDIIGSTALDKTYTNKIRELIDNNNLNQHIKIWGQVDDKDYIDLFNKANAFAFINIDQSWGLAVFEAMSCGLPTIVSNSVGAVELLNNGKDSIIVNPTDVNEICTVIERLMIDSNYYNEISNSAARAVKEYTWDALYSSKMFEIFKTL